MAGRKPKPTALKTLQGNPGKRPLNKKEPKPITRMPTPPSHLSPSAKAEWKRIAPELKTLGLISYIDRAALAAYCQAYGRWVEAEKVIAEKGTLYKTKSGNIQTSPMLWVANKALEQMYKFLTEFGLSPASRARLSTSIEKPKDDIDDFMERGKKTKGNIVKVKFNKASSA